MILLLTSLASAVTVEIGDSGAYPSIWAAYPQVYVEGEVTEFVLLPDYRSEAESPFGDGGFNQGLAFGTEVIVRSSVPGELRVSVPIHAYRGATVRVVDLDLQASTTNYGDPLSSTSQGGYPYVPTLLATDEAELIAEGCRVSAQTFTSTTGAAMAFGANLTLIGSELTGNTPGTGSVNPHELMNYTVGLRENGNSGSFALTLIDTVIENASGPAVAVFAEGNPQSLNIDGGRIADTIGGTSGTAVYTFAYGGAVNSTVTGLRIENAGNTAVSLQAGTHNWSEVEILGATGNEGGAFHLAAGANLALDRVRCEDCEGNTAGGLVFMKSGSSLVATGVDMVGGGGGNAGAIWGQDNAVSVKQGRFCGVSSSAGPLLYTSSDLFLFNNVFRNLPSNGSPVLLGAGGNLEAVNNTFVDVGDPLLEGSFSSLIFVNNALANVNGFKSNSAQVPSDLNFRYNLFHEVGPVTLGAGGELGDGNLVDTEPGFVEAFLQAPEDCAVDPLPALGSVMIDGGAPDIPDNDGTRSDIGAFGGPGAEDSEVSWSPADEPLTLMGGCSGSGLAAFLLALPLLGLNRKRRQWAKQD